jgi:hypothetical protein
VSDQGHDYGVEYGDERRQRDKVPNDVSAVRDGVLLNYVDPVPVGWRSAARSPFARASFAPSVA